MAKDVIVILDRPALAKFLGWNGEVGRRFERLAKESKFRIAGRAPKRHGGLAASVSYTKGRGSRGIQFDVGSDKSYAAVQETGGRPHTIRTKNPPYGKMRFFWKKVGHVVYFSKVSHPGNPATHYIEKGFERALRMWERGG